MGNDFHEMLQDEIEFEMDMVPVVEMEDEPFYQEYLDEMTPEPKEKRILDNHGKEISFVGVYEVHRSYGGPEEGGWWYDSGELVEQFVCDDDEMPEFIAELKEKYPRQEPGSRDYYCNVLYTGGDYRIDWSRKPMPNHFPEVRPHYE